MDSTFASLRTASSILARPLPCKEPPINPDLLQDQLLSCSIFCKPWRNSKSNSDHQWLNLTIRDYATWLTPMRLTHLLSQTMQTESWICQESLNKKLTMSQMPRVSSKKDFQSAHPKQPMSSSLLLSSRTTLKHARRQSEDSVLLTWLALTSSRTTILAKVIKLSQMLSKLSETSNRTTSRTANTHWPSSWKITSEARLKPC